MNTRGTATIEDAWDATEDKRALGLSQRAARWYERWLRDRYPDVLFSVRVIERERRGDPAGPALAGDVDGRIGSPDDADPVVRGAAGSVAADEDPLDERA